MSPEAVEVLKIVVPAIASVLVALIGARAIAKAEIKKVDNTQLEAVVELEKDLAITKAALAEEKEARERLGADLLALQRWKDEHLAEEVKRREAAKRLAQQDRAETLKQLGEISMTLAVQGRTLDNLLQLAGGFHGLGRALHGGARDGS